MKMFEKIEDLINRGLFWLGDKLALIFGVLWKKICPSRVQAWLERTRARLAAARDWRAKLRSSVGKVREAQSKLKDEYKGVFAQAVDAAKKSKGSPLKALGAPFAFLVDWAKTLSPVQSLLLFGFTFGSLFAVVGIGFNSHRILQKSQAARAPASVEELYMRPEYYKKETRETTFTNVKVPVFVQGLNELKSLIIDFSVITSNRQTKRWLERHEFQARDHLVLGMEPVIPSFPMSEEGKVVITNKIQRELNAYLEENKIDGEVLEVRIIYILGN